MATTIILLDRADIDVAVLKAYGSSDTGNFELIAVSALGRLDYDADHKCIRVEPVNQPAVEILAAVLPRSKWRHPSEQDRCFSITASSDSDAHAALALAINALGNDSHIYVCNEVPKAVMRGWLPAMDAARSSAACH